MVEFVRPIKKWFGVIGSGSVGLTGTRVSGRECIMFAASINRLLNVSTCGTVSFSVTRSTLFALWTKRSHTPPASGFPGQLNIHSILFVVRSRPIVSNSKKSLIFRISPSAPTKFIQQSDRIRDGTPRVLQKFRMNSRQASVERSCAISICTARMVRHVKSAIHRFSRRLPIVTLTDPK